MKRQVLLVSLFVATWTPHCLLAAGERQSPDPTVLAAEIDRLVGEKLKANHIPAAPRADDAAFFRRLNLVLGGRVPVPSEVRTFLADESPDKYRLAVQRLLASAAFVNHMTTSWRGWLLPEAVTSLEAANAVPAFETWLRGRIRDEVAFQRIVAELLTYPLNGRLDGEDGTGPLAFYTAKEGKPENLAAATARVFLGVRLECAQCHDHPFARWRRDQFWGLAAFYGGVERPSGGALRETLGRRELLVPNSDRAVPATFLDDREPEWQYKKSPRVTLAAWLTRPDNPFFARAIVNRLWSLVFGIGLVDPVDDFHDKNPPSHPELLDALARAFVASGYDIKFLLGAICASETFARASDGKDRERQDVRLFARYPVQALSPEQLYDSFAVVLGERSDGTAGQVLQALGTPRRQFLETFAVTDRLTEAPTTILQALTLMNGSQVGGATSLASSRLLGAVLKLPGLTPTERIGALYLTVLSRPPRPRERALALKHVGVSGPEQLDPRYADLLWALLNGVEFRTNH
jgi:hypothetical protein